VGDLPEMESSKAAAHLLLEHIKPGNSILDVGCGAGHYLRSLRSIIKVPFTYTGVDVTPMFIEKANQAWEKDLESTFQVADVYDLPFADSQFDIVMCNNMLYHLPSIVKPIAELMRVSSRLLSIRMLIGNRSFYIKEVHSTLWDQHTEVEPESEFDDNGEPVSFNYLNIYSRAYLEGTIRRAHADATINILEDTFFDPSAIEQSRQTISHEARSNAATHMVGGMQSVGYILQPFNFVFAKKHQQS
jgi:ubiquinone/menaquinone biosynthesis C-methylase UbiE